MGDNNNNNNNNKKIICFLNIWRNVYIKKIIIEHIRFSKIINKILQDFGSLDSFIKFKKEFKYIEHINFVKLRISDKNYHVRVSLLLSLDQVHDVNEKNKQVEQQLQQVQVQDGEELVTITNQINKCLKYFQNNSNASIIDLNMHNIDRDDNPTTCFGKITSNQIPKTVKELSIERVSDVDNEPVANGFLSNLTNLSSLSFTIAFDQLLKPGHLPNKLLKLSFPNCYDKTIEIGVLPPTLEYLKFGNNYPKKLIVGSLPTTLKHLEFTGQYNQALERGVLPICLKTLIIPGYSTSIKQNVLPESLETLQLINNRTGLGTPNYTWISKIFNGSLLNFPLNNNNSKIKCITISSYFDYKILASFKSLTSITIEDYDMPLVPKMFPQSLTFLKFQNFNNGGKTLSNNILPENLEYFDPSNEFNQMIEIGALPNKCLKFIRFGKKFRHTLTKGILPACLEIIELEELFHIEEFLFHQSFQLQDNSKTIIKFKCRIYSDALLCSELKDSITELETFKMETGSESLYPPNLKSLILKGDLRTQFVFNTNSFNNIQNSLTSLQFPNTFYGNLNGCLKNMTNLINLQFHYLFNQPLIDELPTSIQTLKIGRQFDINNNLLNVSLPFLTDLYIYGCVINDKTKFTNFTNLKTIHCGYLDYNSINNLDFNKYEIKIIN